MRSASRNSPTFCPRERRLAANLSSTTPISTSPAIATDLAPKQRREVLAITGLRGIGAIAILVYHMAHAFKQAPALAPAVPFIERYYVFLDLFFIVSGFAIAGGHAQKFMQRLDRAELSDFIVGRIIRIYPLHLITLAAAIGLEVMWWYGQTSGMMRLDFVPFEREGYTPLSIIPAALLLHAYDPTPVYTWNVPAWYLSALLFAYLVFPFAMRASALLKKSAARLIVLLFGTLSTIYLQYVYAHGMNWSIPNAPFRGLFEVMFGVGIGLAPALAAPRWVKSALQVAVTVLALALLHSRWDDYVLIPVLGLFVYTIRDDIGPIARALSVQPLVWLGRVSFSLYMIHWVLLTLFGAFPGWAFPATRWLYQPDLMPLLLAISILLIIGVSWLTYRFIETPLTASLQRWWKGEARAPVGLRT